MICNMRVNAAILTVYRDIFAGGEKIIFDHFFARPGRPGRILKCFQDKTLFGGGKKKKKRSWLGVFGFSGPLLPPHPKSCLTKRRLK